MTRLHASVLAILLSGLASPATAQVVIVNSANGNAALNKEQVEQIFLGKSISFPNGSPAMPVDNAALRDAFYPAVSGKSGDQAKAYWAKLEFTGKGRPPSEIGNGKAVAEFVARNPSAIGYVDKNDVGAGTKSVLTLP